MIDLVNITKKYGDLTAIKDLSLSVNTGEVCVLIGPSGCGKTTTLRIINRLILPTSGQVLVDRKRTDSIRPEELRRSMGYVIQNVGLFPHMKVADNISVVPRLLKWEKQKINNRIEELLVLVGLDPQQYYSKYPSELSGGEAQRIGVARALAADPPILLMDEPFGAVDPLNREKLQSQFLNIQKKLHKTIVMVTHDLDEAIRLADRITIMRSGELIQYDTPEEILTNPSGKFVRDFVGTDRALKRLSRMKVETFMHPAHSIGINESLDNAKITCRQCRWLWVVDELNRLKGWVDMTMLSNSASLIDAMVTGDKAEIAVTADSSLRETLSRMLGQGFQTVPVVDEKGRLTGEMVLSDIEDAISRTENEQ